MTWREDFARFAEDERATIEISDEGAEAEWAREQAALRLFAEALAAKLSGFIDGEYSSSAEPMISSLWSEAKEKAGK